MVSCGSDKFHRTERRCARTWSGRTSSRCSSGSSTPNRSAPDDDGDYPVRYRNALYYVRLVGDVDPVVQVFSVAVSGVAPTAALFKELNTINSTIKFARAFWVREQVLVETELVGEGVEPADFDNACRAVATITDHSGPRLAEKFGGETVVADEKTETATEPAAAAADEVARTGQYL